MLKTYRAKNLPELIELKYSGALLVFTREEYFRALKRGKSVIRNRRYAQELRQEKENEPIWANLIK